MLNLHGHTILLASHSPRRRELLQGLGLPFRSVSVEADESYPETLREGDIPMYIARAKARAYATLSPTEILLTADTIVWSEGTMLGKPANEDDARRMLHMLSGRTHQVYTAVCMNWLDANGVCHDDSFVDKTDVTFRPLTDEEIDYYITTFRPLDKAGAYGIQEWIGYVGVTGINGCYFNVMGLPLQPLYAMLKNWSLHYNA